MNVIMSLSSAGSIALHLTLSCVFSTDGELMFQQVPLVKINGMKLVQAKAILHYIAEKYNFYGKDVKDHAMYVLLRNNNRLLMIDH